MQRVVFYLKRRPDLSQPLFFVWWLGQHRAMAEQLPGLRQYIISLAADAQESPFDGMAELWCDDLTAAEAAFASPAGRAARADAEAYVVQRELLYVTEHTIIDHPTPPPLQVCRRPQAPCRHESGGVRPLVAGATRSLCETIPGRAQVPRLPRGVRP